MAQSNVQTDKGLQLKVLGGIGLAVIVMVAAVLLFLETTTIITAIIVLLIAILLTIAYLVIGL